jgi:hypothetical protein
MVRHPADQSTALYLVQRSGTRHGFKGKAWANELRANRFNVCRAFDKFEIRNVPVNLEKVIATHRGPNE